MIGNIGIDIVVFGLLAIPLKRRLDKTAANRGAKLSYILSVLYLLYFHHFPSNWVVKLVMALATDRIGEWREAFHIDEGILPIEWAAGAWVGAMLAGTIVMVLAAAMFFKSSSATRAVGRLIPLIYLLDSFIIYFHVLAAPGRTPFNTLKAFVFSQLLFAVSHGWIYILMFLFFRSSKVDSLFCFDGKPPEETGDV